MRPNNQDIIDAVTVALAELFKSSADLGKIVLASQIRTTIGTVSYDVGWCYKNDEKTNRYRRAVGSEVSSNLCFNIIDLRIRPPPMGADAFSNLQETVERGKPANLRLQWPHQLWGKDLDLVAGWWQILRGGRSDIFFQRRLLDTLNSERYFHETGRYDDMPSGAVAPLGAERRCKKYSYWSKICLTKCAICPKAPSYILAAKLQVY